MSDFLFNPNHLTWVEKYRPLTVDDCILPERTKKILKGYIEAGSFPSLLFYGIQGTGKTTAAQALCSDMNLDTLLINVSKNRGIDVLRNEIENFATSVSLEGNIKCIILDEFDGATEILQRALRATMEAVAINCVFILTCNHPNKIMEAIHSRCAKIDMKVDKSEVMAILKQYLERTKTILDIEGIKYESKALATLISKSYPDYRSVLNQLQHLSKLGKIDMEVVENADREVSIVKLVKSLKEKDFKAMRQWVASNANSDANILFTKVYEELDGMLKPSSIPEVIVIMAQYQHQAVTAINPEINLCACFVEIMAVGEFV